MSLKVKQRWMREIKRLGDRILKHSSLLLDSYARPKNEGGDRNGQPVFAAVLLARTMSNFRAIRLLLKERHIIEARVLTRCCYENLFWIAALEKKGLEFVDDIWIDNEASVHRQANRAARWAEKRSEVFNDLEELRSELSSKRPRGTKRTNIQHQRAAVEGGVEGYYLVYSDLSGDAAHPSDLSLQRHLGAKRTPPHFKFPIKGHYDENESFETIGMALAAFLNISAIAYRIMLGDVADEFHLGLIHDFTILFGKPFGWDAATIESLIENAREHIPRRGRRRRRRRRKNVSRGREVI